MSEDNWGAAEPIRQSIHDLVTKIGTHLGLIPTEPGPDPAHTKAIEDMNQQINAHANDAANASFAAAQAKMKGQANQYDSTQKKPLKSYSK